VQMAKNDPEAQSKSSLSDCTWLENEHASFNLETLEFLMHFREPGSSLYFIFYTHSYFFFSFFFFLFLILIFFFLYLFFSFFSLFLSHRIFLFAPL
jgi:hypothetical protein